MTITAFIILVLILVYWYLVQGCYDSFRSFGSGEYKLGEADPARMPDTDIIVAAKNEQDNIAMLADSINSQTHKSSRLIFVDDHSTDSTADEARRLFQPPHSVIESGGKGKKDALRTGIAQSTGEYILSTDADCFPRPRWAELMVAAAQLTDADMVMAPVIIEPIDSGKLFQRLQTVESFAMITITGGTCLQGRPVMCNGGNIGYRASFLKGNADGMNKKYASGDDMFMMETASRKSRRFAYVRHPDAVIRTKGVATWKALLNQRARWVSKTGGYTSKYILFFAFVILLGNLAAIASLVLPLLGIMPWWAGALVWIAKGFTDAGSALASASFYGERLRFWDVVLLEICYPFYVVASVASALTRGFKWK